MKIEDWSDTSTSQGIPKSAGKPPEIRNRQARISLQASEGVWFY